MNYKQILDRTADELKEIISIDSLGIEIQTEDFGWVNHRYISDLFRIAHIERYSDKNIEVLHFTCFPNVDSPEPIFGFDTITTDKKPLAFFLDWSPVDNINELDKPNYNFEVEYKLPDWAKSIFSKNFLAIVPRETELDIACHFALQSFRNYLNILSQNKTSPNRIDYIVAKQNYYCDQQQKNERTLNVLKSKLGKERALYFMENILFPKIEKK